MRLRHEVYARLPQKRKRCAKRKNLVTNRYSKRLRKPDNNRRRATYFKAYRPERKALAIIENTQMIAKTRTEYRDLRLLYHRYLPHLARKLVFPPDRERIINVEHDVYTAILSYHWIRGRRTHPMRMCLWWFSNPDCNLQSPAKL